MHPCDPHACPEYNALTRRRFLAAGSGAALALASTPAWLPRVALARDYRSSQRDVIVAIYLRGAADGLSICVPWGEQAYYDARPTLNVPRPTSGLPNSAIDLDGFFGLAPAMAPLTTAYDDGNLMIVHACGSTDPSRSHFEAQRFMEIGKPGDNTLTTGWLGRHLASIAPKDPGALLRGVGISSGLQQSLAGGPLTLPIQNLDDFGLTGSSSSAAARTVAIDDMYTAFGGPTNTIAQTSIDTIALLNTINFEGYVPYGGATYPTGSFGTALRSAAALIKANVGVEAIAIDLGGWDTHNAQGTTAGFLAGLMGTLAQGIAAFYADMNQPNAPTYTLVTNSEFGRRVAENGSAGTDHGHGGVMFVMGTCVNGGQVKSIWPGLSPGQLYDDRDLDVTIDYRDVLAEIVQNRLGNGNLSTVFPGHTPMFRGVLAC